MAGVSVTHYYGDVLTLAGKYEARPEDIPDNIFDGYPLLEFLAKKGRVQWYDGGDIIQEPLMYGSSGGGGSYANYDVLDTSSADNHTAAMYNRKGYYESVAVSGQELRAAANPNKVKDLVKARVQNARMRMLDQMNADLWSDGTGNNQKAVGGMQAYVKDTPATDPTINVGGIAAATNSWWRNYHHASIGSFASNGIAAFDLAWRSISRGKTSGIPNVIIGTSTGYGYLETWDHGKQQLQITATAADADPGLGLLRYKKIPVLFDLDCPADAASKAQFYWLQTNFMFLRCSPQAFFMLDDWIRPANQESIVAQLLWEGNLTLTNRRHQGLLNGFDA